MDYQEDYEDDEYGGSHEFQQAYYCYPSSATRNPDLENGGKIIMPASALSVLSRMNINFPYMFSIQNRNSGRVSHCGVLEFTADEGMIIMPEWMMQNLQLDEGDVAVIRKVALETGTYFKLQPHATAFIELVNPKAVLENRLRHFSCLSCGDTIMVMHDGTRYYIDVVETRPDNAAICILETDCEVDFAPPLDYKEPEIKPREKEVVEAKEPPNNNELEPKFMPFTGVARRLDGKPAASADNPSRPRVLQETVIKKENTDHAVSGSRKKAGKLVFGSNDTRNTNQSGDHESCKPCKDDQKEEDGSNKLEPKFQPFSGKKYSLKG